jgi:predicted transposase YbfD/YdcC
MARYSRVSSSSPPTPTRPGPSSGKRGVRPGEAELTVLPRLLADLVLDGLVVTGDALLAQRELCAQIVDQGGDYLVSLKGNQPTLLEEVVTLFADPPAPPAVATQRDRHGDRHEVRTLAASTALTGYSDWPALGQVCRIERQMTQKGRTTTEVAYAITSLWPQAASPARLLALRRGHWGIENRLHWVRDVTFGEDASQVRTGAAPYVLAALRNVVIGLLRLTGATNIAATLRRHAAHPAEALALLGLPLSQDN